MTPQQQQIAVAKAIGYRQCEVAIAQGFRPEESWRKGDQEGISSLPDYLNDLNAMHEAEKYAIRHNESLRRQFAFNLFEIVLPNARSFGFDEVLAERGMIFAHATAEQRAEAFLKSLNLWTP